MFLPLHWPRWSVRFITDTKHTSTCTSRIKCQVEGSNFTQWGGEEVLSVLNMTLLEKVQFWERTGYRYIYIQYNTKQCAAWTQCYEIRNLMTFLQQIRHSLCTLRPMGKIVKSLHPSLVMTGRWSICLQIEITPHQTTVKSEGERVGGWHTGATLSRSVHPLITTMRRGWQSTSLPPNKNETKLIVNPAADASTSRAGKGRHSYLLFMSSLRTSSINTVRNGARHRAVPWITGRMWCYPTECWGQLW